VNSTVVYASRCGNTAAWKTRRRIMNDQVLVSAKGLEERGILKKGTAYRMAKLKLIPCSYVGSKHGGIRFSPPEVLAALRRPAEIESPAVRKEEARRS
jgi:hypothetical protein